MTRRLAIFPLVACSFLLLSLHVRAEEKAGWTILSTPDFKAWRGKPTKKWRTAKEVHLDGKNPRKLEMKPGEGIIVTGLKGRGGNLYSKKKFGDIELHMEFLIPKRSNSGVKFHGHYEIQIMDSYGKKKATASDCGGVYPRAEMRPRYHHIDKGIPPKINAALPPGQWQTLEAIFLAPRFDSKGKKIANARLLKVTLNGKTIHENVELKTPTGHLWRLSKEVATGPLMLQGDHGPVAFRNVRVRPFVKGKNQRD